MSGPECVSKAPRTYHCLCYKYQNGNDIHKNNNSNDNNSNNGNTNHVNRINETHLKGL